MTKWIFDAFSLSFQINLTTSATWVSRRTLTSAKLQLLPNWLILPPPPRIYGVYRIDGIWPNVAYALILTRSRLGLLGVNCLSISYTRVMALDDTLFTSEFRFRSVSSLQNKWMEFNQILQLHWYWQDLGWDCYTLVFANYGPWFRFRSITWEKLDGIRPNFA